MSDKQLSLHHLTQFPPSAQNQPSNTLYPTILALHGLGSNEADLMGLADHLPRQFLWISPRAPLVFGPNSYEWYRVKVIGQAEPEHVMSALESIDHFIDEIFSMYPIDPQKLYLFGFSQGSLLSMCYTLIHPSRVAGVVAQSGYIPNHIDFQIDQANLKAKPFILTHGKQDTLIPIEWARASRDRLLALGIDLTYEEFQMGHHVSLHSLEVISDWLKEQLRK